MRRSFAIAPFFVLFLVSSVSAADRSIMTLRRTADRTELRDNGGTLVRTFDTTSSVVVNGSAGDDTLVVDFSGGNPIPNGLEFNGGAEATPQGDVITIQGGSFDRVVVDYTNRHDGVISLDDTIIKYTGLEPVDMSGTTVANLVFNLPPTGSNASLQDDGTAGNNILLLHSVDASFEDTSFAKPTNSLTVNSGGGTTTISTSANFSGDFTAGLTIGGSAGTTTVNLNNLSLTTGSAALSVTSPAINLNAASISTTNGQSYSGPVTLGATTTLTSTSSGDISFNQTLNGNFGLTVNTAGGSNFFGAAGGVTPLASLATDAPGLTRISANVSTAAGQTYRDQVALFNNATLASTAGGALSFANIDNAFNLSIITTGSTTFNNPVGSLVQLNSLSVGGLGTAAINGGSISTNGGGQTYTAAVTLGSNAVLTTGGSAVTFNSTVDGPAALTVNTSGVTSFSGPVGLSIPLLFLTTDAPGSTTIHAPVVTFVGQNYNDAVNFTASVGLSSIGSGNISFASTVNGAFSITVNTAGTTTFGGPVGNITPLLNLSTDAPGSTAINGGSITTTGGQTYNDAVTLGASNTLTSTSGGSVAFAAVNGAFALSVVTGGTTIFGGPIGGTTPLNSLTTDAAGLTLLGAGSVTTTGPQSYDDAVILTANATLVSTASGDISFNSPLDGTFALVVNTAGKSIFLGGAGGGTPLTSITVDAPGLTRVANNVTTTGAQNWNDQLALFGNVTMTSTSSGAISFANVDNGFALTINTAGPTTFNNPVGSLSALTSIVTDAAGSTTINGGSITTANSQTFNDPVTLGAITTLTSQIGGNITLAGTLNGGSGLTVNTAGITTFGGAVGGITPLASATTDAAGSTAINGGAFATTGAQTFNDPVTLGANTTFTSNGNITFPGTLAGAFSVTKAGPGVMTLATPNTYTGGTQVNGGTLLVTNVAGSGTGPGPVAVANGATLAGTGTIAGSAIAQSGGFFAPGNAGIGTLAIQGSASWNGSAGPPTAIFDLNNAGATSDRLSILGVFVKGPGPVFKFDFGGTGSINTYTLATFGAGATFSASDFTFTNLAPGLDGFFTMTANQLHFNGIASAATHFLVSAPASATAGTPFNITVTALDALNNVDPTYAGTVHFTTTDGSATLPADATLSGGTGTFSVTLRTSGSQTVTATDTVTASITGTSNTILVSAGAATHFAVSAPASATAGTAFSFTVTALDQFNNTATGYAGTVNFTSTSAGTLPANSTLTNGVGAFSATLNTAGNQTITSTDTVSAPITGTSNAIAVSAGAATHFSVSAPASATAGVAFNFTVTALDQFNNVATGYAGTVHFTSTSAGALPANSTLTNGTGTFSATLDTAGSQTITATDTVSASITGTSNAIAVSAGAATHFSVSAPASATAGVAFNFAVTALDQFNNTATSYAGTVHFTSTSTGTLPANSTLTNGAGTFSATLNTPGNQTMTAADTVSASITGTSNTIAVSASGATHFSVSAPASATAGVAFNFTVTALDQFNNTATGYAGTVHFSSTSAGTLPANSTLTNGTGTFSATLDTVGSQTITATDTVSPSITGTSNAIAVSAGPATHFSVSAPASATTGGAFNFSVTALDQFNNPATAYAGTVHFTSSDATATLPANSTLTSGAGTFTATLNTAGSQTITATDTVNASITGTSNAIAVSLANADVGITKTASAGPYLSGNPITYTIVVSNAGPATATGVTVADTLPAGTSFGSATSTQGSCSGTTTVTCSIGTVANGGSATITLVVTLPTGAGFVSNTASVTSTTADTNPANDSATSTVNVGLSGSIPALSQILLMMLAAMLMMIAVVRLRG